MNTDNVQYSIEDSLSTGAFIAAAKETVERARAEVSAILSELRDPFRALILLASVTGLRRGELFGLKWEDVDFEGAEIRIVRSVVDQVEGPPKTLASRRPIPMSSELASALANWRKQTSYSKPGNGYSPALKHWGRNLTGPDAVLKRHVLPAGIAKRIGWHTFRRTVATLLLSSGASVKTTQELMRHASPDVTVGFLDLFPRWNTHTNRSTNGKSASSKYWNHRLLKPIYLASTLCGTHHQYRMLHMSHGRCTYCSQRLREVFPIARWQSTIKAGTI